MARGVEQPVRRGGETVTTARPRRHPGDLVLWAVVALFVAVVAPVVVRGAPLADDFTNCASTARMGFASTLGGSIERLGASRKAHLLEILVTGGVCHHAPFGLAIAVPLLLTIAIAFLLRSLLLDLGVPRTWANVGGALWLLAPLGTESALWPAALHVPLGIALAILAVRLHRHDRSVLAALTVAGAGLSVEQVLLALPIAVWMMTPPARRGRATIETIAVIAVLLAAFVVWPGNDPRLHVTLGERIAEVFHDPMFPLLFAGVGLGLQSIPLAVEWALPASVVVLAAGAFAGWRLVPHLAAFDARDGRPAAASDGVSPAAAWSPARVAVAGLVLLFALNIPVVLNVPHEGSPRLFAPSWLVIAACIAIAGASVGRERLRPWGAVAGVFVAGALLSLALTVWVRLESADFTAYAVDPVATGLPTGSTVAVCGVTRTVVHPAPRGAFQLHEFDYDWAARDAVEFYTGKRLSFVIAGGAGGGPCPAAGSVDRVVAFERLVSDWRSSG
jgi:hypothetical protein